MKKDFVYGGVFFTEKAASRAAKNGGCPPIEIMMPYINGDAFSAYSRVKMDKISKKLETHVSKCSSCQYFIARMREHAPPKELN